LASNDLPEDSHQSLESVTGGWDDESSSWPGELTEHPSHVLCMIYQVSMLNYLIKLMYDVSSIFNATPNHYQVSLFS
jgi:hypothetical protein